ncbi:hypothetical protein BCR33DRAFT_727874 [Rhizoclosmatium globosum]|uniref:Uncharacterized protein n=1 Tax=Rhizoclosmatium globosum TaxID=329046 RepID=A0A1Y2AMU7_9FUNG|nr:hypothetical protein BCR33DRAFT_727874 [Rhizoclosmatium globosum]|eukprot:ORY23903.1 hypothetical protein BCR33DRAFT_727874 [Rhizoclosmatium globosum]
MSRITAVAATTAALVVGYYTLFKQRRTADHFVTNKERPHRTSTIPSHLEPKHNAPSIDVILKQDILSEIAELFKPIALATILSLEILNLSHSHRVLGVEKVVVEAKDVTVQQFELDECRLVAEDGYLDAGIENVKVLIGMQVKVWNGSKWYPLLVEADVTVHAKVYLTAGVGIGAKVEDPIAVTISTFRIDVQVPQDILQLTLDLLENTIKQTLTSSIQRVMKRSLEDFLDSALLRDWGHKGSVKRVGYSLKVQFLGNPVVSRSEGVRLVVGVDAEYSVDESAGKDRSKTIRNETGKRWELGTVVE